MSLRKPPGERWESLVDRRIREAQARGDFDDLPGKGRPLRDLGRPRDDLWWVRRKLRDEDLSYLPPALQVRKDVEDARAAISRARHEGEVRRLVAEVNATIREARRAAVHGPPLTVTPLDVEQTLRDWRARRREDG